jgi:hypothetical protein
VTRKLGTGVIVLLVAALVASCGSSAGAASPSSTITKRSFAAFTACLKRHGVSRIAGGQPPSGSPPNISSKMQKAFTACASLAPRTGQGGFGPPGGFSNSG